MQQTIPVLDLQDFLSEDPKRKEKFIQGVGDSLVDTGFFALENHNVDKKLIEKAYTLSVDFFSMDEEAKQQYEVTEPEPRGYGSFAKEHVKDVSIPDPKEFWHVGRELLPNSPLNDVYPENVWPTQQPGFKPTFLALYRQLEDCTRHILNACALYICEPKDFFSNMITDGNTILRILHYPPLKDHQVPADLRCAAHEDIDLITLLCGATEEGLQILEKDGSWRSIHAVPGQIIVDAGDMLQNLTNGLFKSTTHRVVNSNDDGARRFSMPFFVHPRPDTDLSPRPNCFEETGGSAKFPSISAGEYFQQRLKEIGLKG